MSKKTLKPKIIKRTTCIILTICLLFVAACSNGNDTPQCEQGAQNLITQGRFVEVDISPPIEGRFITFLSGNNTLISYSEDLAVRAESTDNGETWSTSPGPGANTDRFLHLDRLTLLPDGTLMAFIFSEGLMIIHPDGTSEPFPIEEIDNALSAGNLVMISQLQTVGNDRLLLSYSTISMDSGGFLTSIGEAGEVTFGETGEMIFGEAGETANDETGDVTYDEADEADNVPSDETDEIATDEADDVTYDEAEEPDDVTSVEPELVESEVNIAHGFGSAASTSQLQLIDLNSGELIANIPIDGVHNITSDENYAYLLLFDSAIIKLDIETGTIIDNHGITLQHADAMGVSHPGGAIIDIGQTRSTMAVNPNGGLFSIVHGNLLHADTDGNVSTILDGTMYSIGTPRTSINALFALDDGSIIAGVTSDGQSRLFKYVWDENAVIDPDKTLTIWSLEDNSLVRAAITEFRRNNPTATIIYEVALSGADAIGVSDAIRTLNTRLLSGDSPDVLILDGSPLESYAARGMLFDMSELVNTDDIFANLLEPFMNDESLYFIPTQLLIPTLIGSADALSEVQTLDELVQAVVTGNEIPAPGDGGVFSGRQTLSPDERPALNFEDLKELHDVMWSASAPAIVSNNMLNSEALRQYLEALKAISDKYGLAEDTTDINGMQGMAVFTSVHVGGGGGGGNDPVIMTGSLMKYAMGQANLGAFTASNLMVLPMMFSRMDSELTIFPGLSPGVWIPSTKVGISADANSPEFAAEFINTMLSIDVQQFNYGTGLPITQSGMAVQVNTINDLAAEMDIAMRVDADAFISQLSTPSMTDNLLKDMLWENIERFVKGELDIEGALRAIEQSVRNYLAEREV